MAQQGPAAEASQEAAEAVSEDTSDIAAAGSTDRDFDSNKAALQSSVTMTQKAIEGVAAYGGLCMTIAIGGAAAVTIGAAAMKVNLSTVLPHPRLPLLSLSIW